MKTLTLLFFALILSVATPFAQTSDHTEMVLKVGENIQNTLTAGI